MWEYNVANLILGTDPNAPLIYAPVLELHNPILIILGGRGGQLEREIEIEIELGVPIWIDLIVPNTFYDKFH